MMGAPPTIRDTLLSSVHYRPCLWLVGECWCPLLISTTAPEGATRSGPPPTMQAFSASMCVDGRRATHVESQIMWNSLKVYLACEFLEELLRVESVCPRT